MAGGTLVGSQSVYGNGTTTATSGANTVVHYYDRTGIKAANEINVYQQFADRKTMPQKYGKTFKVSKWTHIYDLDTSDGDFATKGYLGKRDLTTVSSALTATDGSGAGLAEAAGAINQVSPKKVTVSADLARYGYMIPYTDEVEMFSEDSIQVRYREELGRLINRTHEDLIQKDMLNTSFVMYSGDATDVQDVGLTVTAADANAANFKVSFDLIRKGVKALVRNRAERNTSIISGSNKIDTKTVNKAFYAIIGPEVKYDLETLTRGSSYETEFAYIPAYKYAAAGNLAEGEVGAMHDVRFIESEAALIDAGQGSAASSAAATDDYAGVLSTTTYANAAAVEAARGSVWDRLNDVETTAAAAGANAALEYFDIFPILFPTKGSFATVGLKGKGKVMFNSKAPSAIELTNPYGTKGFFSANFWYAGLITQPEKLLRIDVLATA